MANIKSAKKRIEVAAIRTAKNKSIRSEVKTATKKV
ncbi:MAG: 30S ribosomal protein S20, partial [Agathobacter sp.]|nr:30S ribosomal protein S20 [Agathobacter sp.]